MSTDAQDLAWRPVEDIVGDVIGAGLRAERVNQAVACRDLRVLRDAHGAKLGPIHQHLGHREPVASHDFAADCIEVLSVVGIMVPSKDVVVAILTRFHEFIVVGVNMPSRSPSSLLGAREILYLPRVPAAAIRVPLLVSPRVVPAAALAAVLAATLAAALPAALLAMAARRD
jgi:hypothetical protein